MSKARKMVTHIYSFCQVDNSSLNPAFVCVGLLRDHRFSIDNDVIIQQAVVTFTFVELQAINSVKNDVSFLSRVRQFVLRPCQFFIECVVRVSGKHMYMYTPNRCILTCQWRACSIVSLC